MNILIATDTYHPDVNGAAYFTHRLARSLAARGHRVSVAAPSKSWHATIRPDDGVTVYGVPSLPIPLTFPRFRVSPLWMARKHLRRLVAEVRPDVIHIQNHFLVGKAAVEAGKACGIPVVGTNHFMPENLLHYLHLPPRLEERVARWAWKQFSTVYEQLDEVTTPTQTAADLLRAVGFPKPVQAISCGIDLERFHAGYDADDLRTRYAIPSDIPVLLSFGRLEKEKRIKHILSALAMLQRRGVRAHLIVAGVGRLERALQARALWLGISSRVTFTGFIPDTDMARMYALGDIFVIASIAELQSIVTMEAMASGLPIVAAQAMALPELVHDGENGFLFPSADALQLADRLERLLRDSQARARMGEKSLEMIQAHDIRKTVVAFEALYQRVIQSAITSP